MTWQQIQQDFPHDCAGPRCAICTWVEQRPLRPYGDPRGRELSTSEAGAALSRMATEFRTRFAEGRL